MALVRCNLGKLYRLQAYLTSKDTTQFLETQSYYKKCFECYEEAISDLDSTHDNANLLDSVRFDYANAIFCLGTFLQDYPLEKLPEVSAFFLGNIL